MNADLVTTDLHWSFDHNRSGQQPHFAAQFGETLRCHYSQAGDPVPASPWHALRYDVLPNYWHGFSRNSDPAEAMRFGSFELSRDLGEEGHQQYRVVSQTRASGERVQLDFSASAGDPPSLTDEWSVVSDNTAGDLYQRFDARGYSRVEKGLRSLHLVINGNDIIVGSIDARIALSCFGALFGMMSSPGVRTMSDLPQFALLEDLEKLHPNCRLTQLESWTLPMDDKKVLLDGFCVHGTGLPPVYWWIDKADDVIIVASTYQTMVLRERSSTDDTL